MRLDIWPARGARPLPLLFLEDVRGALVGHEQIRPVLGFDKLLERVHARKQPNEVVLSAKRKYRINQVVPGPSLALLDLQPVGEKLEDFRRRPVETVRERSVRELSSQVCKTSPDSLG